MTDEERLLKEQYEALMELHTQPGWALFVEDVQRYLGSRDNIRNVTPERLPFVQGEISALEWVLAQKDVIREIYEDRFPEQKS